MKLLLKLLGLLGVSGFIALLILLVAGAVVWWVLKKRFSGFMTKAVIAGSPPHLHLVRELTPVWDDHDEISERVNALRALGFRALGTYGCQELDAFQLVAMAHAQEGFAAAVFEHPDQGCWVDLATQFRDTGEYLVVSGAPDPGNKPKIPGFIKHFDKKASVEKLFRVFVKKVGHHLVVPVSPENYVSFFETYYAAEMAGYYEALGIEPDATSASPEEPIDRDPVQDEACAPLFRAIHHRDSAQLQQHLQGLSASAGGSLEGRDEEGRTPLMAAVLTGDPAFVEPLIAAGADVNATVPGNPSQPFHRTRSWQEMAAEQDPDSQAAMATVGRVLNAFGADSLNAYGSQAPLTPLILAIWTGSEPVAAALIEAGATTVTGKEPEPLHYAVERGDIHLVNLLLRSGVDLELRDEMGQTPLMVAVREQDVELVQWLLEAGAEVDSKDEDGDTALSIAGYEGAEDIFEVLVPRAKKNIRKARKHLASNADPEQNPVARRLERAAEDGKVARLQRLLGHGLAVDSVADEEGRTALIAAAGAGELRVVRWLLDLKANVNHRTQSGECALSTAVGSPGVDGRLLPDLVQMLLDAGASLDALDAESRQRVVQVLQSRGGVLPA